MRYRPEHIKYVNVGRALVRLWVLRQHYCPEADSRRYDTMRYVVTHQSGGPVRTCVARQNSVFVAGSAWLFCVWCVLHVFWDMCLARPPSPD
jgi:hypothetical protein